jgi:4-amino-4-deoxy-L-arabinose transferase-like glycosyltransferase
MNASPMHHATQPVRRWNPGSIAILVLAWLTLQIGGLFSPGLLDDVDSVYIQIAREMLQRHDFVTPTIDGIRFFDKPPLMYWMAAGSMHLFGIHDWAARLPLALGVLALLFAVYALGIRLFSTISPPTHPDRAALYAALAMATSIGPYLYTRFYIPDILIALWMTLSVHLFLIALERIREDRSSLLPAAGFAAVLALSVLTKGLIGIVFPILFVLLYLAITRQLKLLLKLHIPAATLVFAIIAAPWHILAALRNPAIAMPTGVGLPAHAGWAWFYLYNEHVARFLGKRIPHDYGQVPIPLFWALLILWLVPWAAFLPSAILNAIQDLRSRRSITRFDSDADFSHESLLAKERIHEAALSLLLWPAIILGFFTLSSRQEYYHLPALPALALLVGALLAAADTRFTSSNPNAPTLQDRARRQALRGSLFYLVPLGSLLFLLCGYLFLTAHTPAPGLDLNTALASNPALYNLSLGHVFDLTSSAMGFFRGPLLTVALCMLLLGPVQHIIRRRGRTFAANLLIAASMTGVLLAAHEGLVRFYPILGSEDLAQAINTQRKPGDLILIDGELTSGSTLLFYTGQPVTLVNGHVNGPWFGSFWPDAPHIFANDADLHTLWQGPHRVFLLTYNPQTRTTDLSTFGKVVDVAHSGGKTILSNR